LGVEVDLVHESSLVECEDGSHGLSARVWLNALELELDLRTHVHERGGDVEEHAGENHASHVFFDFMKRDDMGEVECDSLALVVG
jgi:hypothetical protein